MRFSTEVVKINISEVRQEKQASLSGRSTT